MSPQFDSPPNSSGTPKHSPSDGPASSVQYFRGEPHHDEPPHKVSHHDELQHDEPIHIAPFHNKPRHIGPFSSLVVPWHLPGELKFHDFIFPISFQHRVNGAKFCPIPTDRPIRILATHNGYILGKLDHYHKFFGIYAKYRGYLRRFKIPSGGGIPELMHPAEVKGFPYFRQFKLPLKNPVGFAQVFQ